MGEEPTNTRRVFDKIFIGNHEQCIFDCWTEDGKVHRNLDYTKIFVGEGNTGRKVVKMRLHCKTCINKTCSANRRSDHFIGDYLNYRGVKMK